MALKTQVDHDEGNPPVYVPACVCWVTTTLEISTPNLRLVGGLIHGVFARDCGYEMSLTSASCSVRVSI